MQVSEALEHEETEETSLLTILRRLLWMVNIGTRASFLTDCFFSFIYIVFQCSDVFRTSNPEAIQVQELNVEVLVLLLKVVHTACDRVEFD